MKRTHWQIGFLAALWMCVMLLSACGAAQASQPSVEEDPAPSTQETTAPEDTQSQEEPTLESLLGDDSVNYLTETISGLGEVPVAPFALPSTSQIPDSLRPYVAGCNGALLANHGAIAWGRDLWHAFDRMEQVEQTAKIFALVHQLGGGVELSPEQVGAIRGLEGHYRTLSGSRTPHEEQGGGRT